MKKSVLVLLLLLVLIIIVSPGIVGKLAEQTVDENLEWAARESGELVVSAENYDRGWFSSEGQHRIEIGEGGLRTALSANSDSDELPVLIINTHIDHGLIPLSSMGREQGSLAPGLGSAVSTLAIEIGNSERIELPGAIYSKLGFGGDLDSRYTVEAGARSIDGGEVTWQPSMIQFASNFDSGSVAFNGDIGAMTFGNDQQVVAIDRMSLVGRQEATGYGFKVGDVEMSIGPVNMTSGDMSAGGMQGMSLSASSAVSDGIVSAEVRLEIDAQTVPGFGEISVLGDIRLDGVDATALGALISRLEEQSDAQDASLALQQAQQELKDLLAAGLDINVDQFDVALPMGTVETKLTLGIPASDQASFEWASLLLSTVATLDIIVPEELVQLATSMSPQAGALIGMGYLKKDGAAYIMDANLEKGLLTINGAPVPLPLGALQ